MVSLILPSLVSEEPLEKKEEKENLSKLFYLLIYFLVPPGNCLRELDLPKKVRIHFDLQNLRTAFAVFSMPEYKTLHCVLL